MYVSLQYGRGEVHQLCGVRRRTAVGVAGCNRLRERLQSIAAVDVTLALLRLMYQRQRDPRHAHRLAHVTARTAPHNCH